MKILVVDDEEIILNLATRILNRSGYEVITAESGDEALRMITDIDDEISLALIDLTMPGLSGIDTLRQLRDKLPGLPCVISSGQAADQNDIPSDLKAGTLFLQKPYRADQLTDLVNSILVNI